MKLLIIACSLAPKSKSSAMAQLAHKHLSDQNQTVELIYLKDYNLPLCDGGESYKHPKVKELHSKIAHADGVLIAHPVYNYNCNAAAKNMIELTGQVWTGKVVGFIASAGGTSSYMSSMTLANNLMFDFRSIIIPRFIYITGKAFDNNNSITDKELKDRILNLTKDLILFTAALRGITEKNTTQASP